MGRKPTFIVLVRHGERLDEVDRYAWQQMRTHDNQYDPPLTKTGYKQSTQAGKKILKQLEGSGLPSLSTIYSSPTSRTMGTAAAIAKQVSISQVVPAYGLNCCAAAKMTGVGSRYFCSAPTDDTLLGLAAPWPPVGDPTEINKRNRSDRGFVQSIQELASAHEDETLIMVSHREGIWEVLQHFGLRPHKEYCSTHYLWYDHDTQSICIWDPEKDTHRGEKADDAPSPPPRSMPSDLASVLSRGSGRLALKGTEGRALWQTPGVRGLWVKDGDLHPGEIVEVCSSPQASEGDEGDFVLVRKDNGIEGWTKVKNLSSAALPLDCVRRSIPEVLKAPAN